MKFITLVALFAMAAMVSAEQCGIGCFTNDDCSGQPDSGIPNDGSCHKVEDTDGNTFYMKITGDNTSGTVYIYVNEGCPDGAELFSDDVIFDPPSCELDGDSILDGVTCTSVGRGCV